MRVLYPSLLCAVVAVSACRGATAETDDDDGAGGTAGAGGQGGERDPKPLKVLNWNVKNLVDNRNDGAQFEALDPNWEQHVSQVAAVLRELDPDVALLQEVEHDAILAAVVAELDASFVFHRVIDANDPRGIDVGVISKLEPDEVISHQQDLFAKVCYVDADCNGDEHCAPGDGVTLGQCEPDDPGETTPRYRYSRDALEVRITFNGRRLVFFGVHYKSKDSDDPDKRLAEAQNTRVLADKITAADPEVGVFILGDFNDLPGSPALVWSVGEAPDEYGNAANAVPAADRWTFNFQGNLELVDHQLVSPLVFDMLDTSSVRILHSPAVEAASDHAPVIATYNIR